MSLINKMLQDLDSRNAMGSASGPVPPQQVRAVPRQGSGHEWFWRTLALLSMIAVAWVAWVAYQMQPRALATEMALNAAMQPRTKPAPPAAKDVAVTAPVAPAPPATPSAPAPVARVEVAPALPELFKLALSIDRPVQARARPTVARPAAARATGGKDADAARVSKKDIPRSPPEEAEALFRQGANRLTEGRITEAQADFAAALAKYPGHEASRQALIALLIERRRLDEAQVQLEEGLKQNPAQTQFAMVLARVMVERGDYGAAANVLMASQNAGSYDAEYQLLQGAVLQRLGRHAEAIDAFDRAAKIADQPGTTWVAMGISLEAVGRKADALQAYKRSVAPGPLAQDIRTYAENRIRALN